MVNQLEIMIRHSTFLDDMIRIGKARKYSDKLKELVEAKPVREQIINEQKFYGR